MHIYMSKYRLKQAFSYILLACLMTGWSSWAFARQITDMAGRTVTIPDKLERIYSASPLGYAILYSLAPELLCGRATFSRTPIEQRMLLPEVAALPLIGTFGGQSTQINIEALLAVKPQLIVELVMTSPAGFSSAVDSATRVKLDQLGIPYIYIFARDITDYPMAYAHLGTILGKEERARELGLYIQEALDDAQRVVAQVPPAERPKVYYAEGLDGLSTESAETFHTHLLKLAGDVNVHRNPLGPVTMGGFEKISLEHVLAYDPDVILAFESRFYESVFSHSGWRQLRAVQNGRVYWIPRGPFNWFDRPPSFMRGIGLKWLLSVLYPQQYPIDMVQETHDFYRKFLWTDLNDDDIRQLLYHHTFYSF